MNAPEFDAAGNRMRLDGFVLCSFMPDWLTGAWRQDLAQLAGKVKLMPLPAWKKGGRRTTVMGGTMLGIPKQAPDFASAWRYAKHLYLSPDLARELFRTTGIISPIKRNWADPVYDEPSSYFSKQRVGRMYIAAAPDVPARTSSPYNALARFKIGDGALALKAIRQENRQVYRGESLAGGAPSTGASRGTGTGANTAQRLSRERVRLNAGIHLAPQVGAVCLHGPIRSRFSVRL